MATQLKIIKWNDMTWHVMACHCVDKKKTIFMYVMKHSKKYEKKLKKKKKI